MSFVCLSFGHPSPHPPLHFFTYLLQKYFDYRFDDLSFENGADSRYIDFAKDGNIFTKDGKWDGLLKFVSPPPNTSYKPKAWSLFSHV